LTSTTKTAALDKQQQERWRLMRMKAPRYQTQRAEGRKGVKRKKKK
jgi:hypothetical protein